MGLFRHGFISVCSLIVVSGTAASPMHTVRFAQDPVFFVWQDGALVGQGPSLTLFSADRPSVDWMGAGELEPVRVAANMQSRVIQYEIASNSGFVIETTAPNTARPTVRVIDIGPNAQNAEASLSGSDQIVFHQSVKTAARPGSPASQAITIEIEWAGDQPPALRLRAL